MNYGLFATGYQAAVTLLRMNVVLKHLKGFMTVETTQPFLIRHSVYWHV